VGTLNITNDDVEKILEAWVIAREQNSEVAQATFTIAGHLASGSSRDMGSKQQLIEKYRKYAVTYSGPVKRSDLANTYSKFDIALFTAVGAKFVTSGKVYELMATGLPVISAHDPELEAVNVLREYPLWAQAKDFDVPSIAEAIIHAATLIQSISKETIIQAQAYAQQFERTSSSQNFARILRQLLPEAKQ
jgi:glycosyltransferase involved in cell wall biosynthesis